MRPPNFLKRFGRGCHAIFRFSSNSMTVLVIVYGIPSFIFMSKVEPSFKRSDFCEGSRAPRSQLRLRQSWRGRLDAATASELGRNLVTRIERFDVVDGLGGQDS